MKKISRTNKRLVVCFLIILIGSLWYAPGISSGDEMPWWNTRWSFRQELLLPMDTGKESTTFQPIDMPVKFDNPCWAKTEKEHSIRVVYQEGKVMQELDSQIYDLAHGDNTHIISCNLVFLIPLGASGTERYYMYYHSDATSSPSYKDQVSVDESYYQYEPIQGVSFESQFYKITEGNAIVYAVSQRGSFLDAPICQQVTKLQPNAQEVRPNSGEEAASFDLVYWHLHGDIWKKSSTSERLISKELMVDGNLMVKFGMVSQSDDGLFQTTAIYKYYYCPTEDKRINIHAKHELLDYPVPLGDEIDVYYVILRSGGIRSNSIDDLNFGSIPPYLHVFNEENRMITYDLDQYPENYLDTIVAKTDDCDLGSPAWVSVDQGRTGTAHAIIFGSNKILQSGTDEMDGIEVQVYESKVVQLPGLEGRFANVCLGRNAYESNHGGDDHIPKDFVVEFDVEFFSTPTRGYEGVNKEAQLYQALVAYQPPTDTNVTNGEENETHSLVVYAHLPHSLRSRWRQAIALGQTPPCLFAALYQDNALRASGGVSRVAFTKKMTIDWGNISFLRKIRFNHLEEGKYVVKIWLINPFDGSSYEYVGFQVLNITQTDTTHIWCKPQGRIEVTVTDQQGDSLSDAHVFLLQKGTIIAEKVTNAEGIAKLGAPCGIQERYQVQILYDGFELENEEVRLGYIRRFLPVKKTITIDVHDLTIDVRDEQGRVPSVPIDISLTSDSMHTPTTITPDDQSDGQYRFTDLYTATYQVQIDYSPFSITRTIDVPETSSLQITVYDVTVNVKDKWGLAPAVSLDIVLESDEFEKHVVISAEHHDAESYVFTNVYPANYWLHLSYKSFMVNKPITIPHTNETIGITFPALFNVTLVTLDARGNMLSDANVEMKREGKKVNQE
ncbi:MAG: carboxypeptidase regulatory-like domain-containing protein, partial [Candidatus Thermoplasmatota archaeon]|nr:carboxypeptidase regulatory-like domain-containing protein [Candidatus Thermoplasmatota archaeon]